MTFAEIVRAKLNKAQNILISTHLFPDADGIGSEIGFCMALRELGKNCFCINEEELLERYKYLDPDNVVIGLKDINENFKKKVDLVIIVDTNNITRIGPQMCAYIQENDLDVLFIDHHPAPQELMQKHCIDTSSAATGQIVGEIIQELGVDFNQKIALPLYTAILIDTSSFRYPTVTSSTHALISKLVKTGIKPPDAYNGIYGTKKISHMHLLGEILRTTQINKSEEICWIVLRKNTLDKYLTDIEDTHAFINHLLVLDKIKVAMMFREDENEVKVSFRSHGDIDVGKIARKLGGGGHSHSAATILPYENQSLDDIIAQTVQKVETLVD